ncbi:MAG: TolC family protein, partial [Bdellovibrionota bacterium]
AMVSRTGHLGRSYLPTMDVHGGAEAFRTGADLGSGVQPYAGVQANWNLFRGGRDYAEGRYRDAGSALARDALEKTHQEILVEARKNYWNLVSLREAIGLHEKARVQNQQNMVFAKKRIARGLGTETDLLEFEINQGQVEEEIESLTHATLLIELRLAALLGFEEGTRIHTPARTEHQHDEALLGISVVPERNPEVSMLRGQRERADWQREKSARWWLPSVDVYGAYALHTSREREYQAIGDRAEKMVGLRISLQIFDGWMAASERTATASEVDGWLDQENQMSRELRARVVVAKEDLKHEHDLIHSAETRIAQGEKYLRQTLDEYGRGVKNSID